MGRKKRIKLVLPKIVITKRQKFVLVTVVLTFGLLIAQLVKSEFKFLVVGFLAVGTYFLTAWVLKEDLEGIEWLTLLILPTVYTLAVGFFYFLLPVRWITRLPVAFLYGVGIYALLLTENIYNVAAERTIQLLRAAQAVGFLLTLITAFLLWQTLSSLHLPFWGNFGGTFFLSLPLFCQALWTVKLEAKISQTLLLCTLFFSLILAEISLVFSFWPLPPVLASLFLTATMYALLGIGQQYFSQRLFGRAVGEFLAVVGVIFLVLLLTTQWGG